MIPKIIHYCWFGSSPLPREVRKSIESWEKYCPDYKIIQWDENNFDVTCHPFSKSAYDAKAWAFVSDYARLRVVYDYGGIYLDTDVELLRNLDFLLENQFYIGVQQAGHLCTTGLGFGASKNSSIVGKMLKLYDDISFNLDEKKRLACPYLNDSIIKELGYVYTSDKIVEIGGALILPEKYMDPIAPGAGMLNLKCAETISIHHYSASWMGRKIALKRKLIRLIGQDKVNNIKKIIISITKY